MVGNDSRLQLILHSQPASGSNTSTRKLLAKLVRWFKTFVMVGRLIHSFLTLYKNFCVNRGWVFDIYPVE